MFSHVRHHIFIFTAQVIQLKSIVQQFPNEVARPVHSSKDESGLTACSYM